MKSMLRILPLLVLPLLAGCAGSGRPHGEKVQARHAGPAHEVAAIACYTPGHAAGFALTGFQGRRSTLLTVKNPWQGATGVEERLLIVRGDEPIPAGFAGSVVRAPVRRVVCMSSSHVALLDALGLAGCVKGVSGGAFITNPLVRHALERGSVAEVGYDSNIDFEMLVALRPDVVLIYGVTGESQGVAGKLRELGIPYTYIGDYLEESPLGKAEWMVAVGELCDRRAQAEAIFHGIAQRYDSLRECVARRIGESRPVVMLNTPYRDIWYVPSDNSYMVALLRDAGGRYACAGNQTGISRPIGLEEAYVKLHSADVWLNTGQVTRLRQLVEENPHCADARPVRLGRVYNNNRRTTPAGGSDFWESGAVHPDQVLLDLAAILHPGLFPDHQLEYYRKIE